MAIYDRSHDPLADGRRPMPTMGMSLLLAAVAAIVLVLAIYSISHSVGPAANDSSSVVQPRESPNRRGN